MLRSPLLNLGAVLAALCCLQAPAALAENRRDIRISCGGTTVTEQIALKVSEAGATWTVRVYADNGCQFKKSTATIVEGLTAVNWNSPHVAEHVTEVTYQVRVTDQSKEGKMTIIGELEPRPGTGGGHGGSGSGGSGQPKTFSVTVLLRVVELEFTSPANGAPLSVCVGGSANLTAQVRVGDGKPPSTGTVTWQVSAGLPGTTPSPTPLQEGIAETTFTSNGSLTSGAGTITAEAKDLKDANGKPMPDVSATLPGYVTKVIGITPPNPTCELGGEVELTAVLYPPDAPVPPCLTWSVYPTDAGTITQSGGAAMGVKGERQAAGGPAGAKATFRPNQCTTSNPQVKATAGSSQAETLIRLTNDRATWRRLIINGNGCPSTNCTVSTTLYEEGDDCGNVARVECICNPVPYGNIWFSFIPRNQGAFQVGVCCFLHAAHTFWVREVVSANGSKRFVETFHFVSDLPLEPDGDSGSNGKVDYRVRRYRFVLGEIEKVFGTCGSIPIPADRTYFQMYMDMLMDPRSNTDGRFDLQAQDCDGCPP